MKNVKAALLVACLPLSLSLSCGGGGGNDGGGGGGSASVTCTDGTIIANEANDYAFSSTITLQPTTVKDMSNLTFDWGGVTKDFLGHTVDTTKDLNTIVVMLWDLPLSQFESELNTDSLFTSDLVVSPPPSINPTGGATTAKLYDFGINGTALSPDMFNQYFDASMYTPSNSTFIVGAQTGTELGSNIRMLQAFQLDSSSSNTTVTLTNSSTSLQYTANLHDLHPTGVPAGKADLSLDWTDMDGQKNALGQPFVATNITSAIVGHYNLTPSQLQSQFLDLDTIATDYYKAEIDSGTVLNFTMLKDGSGNSFPGVSSDGTWLVGLICGNCRNPAPWYLTILVPATQPCTGAK